MADSKLEPATIRQMAEILAKGLIKAKLGNPVNEADITNKFLWGDPTVYRWTIRNQYFLSLGQKIWFMVSAVLGGLLAGLTLAVLPIWLIGLKWGNVSFWIAVCLFGLLLVNLLKDHLLLLIGSRRVKLLMQTHLIFFAVFPMVVLGYVMMSPFPFMRQGFTGNTDSGSQWLLFFLDHVKDVILLGIPGAAHWDLARIEPVVWYSRLASQILKMLIALGLIDFVVLIRRLAFSEIEFYGTVKDASFQCHPLKNFSGWLRREARLVRLVPDIVPVNAFRRAYPFDPKHDSD